MLINRLVVGKMILNLAKGMIALANETNSTVTTKLIGIWITANPGDDPRAIAANCYGEIDQLAARHEELDRLDEMHHRFVIGQP